MDLGLLYTTDRLPVAQVRAFARSAEESGIESLWLPEVMGRDPFSLAGDLFANTDKMRVATGIANLWARDPAAMHAGATTLAELSDGRFLLGLGVSNPDINKARGNPVWEAPLPKMRRYLESMDNLQMSLLRVTYPRYLAAHAQGLLGLARDMADGALTYLMTADHTGEARRRLGSELDLSPVMFVLVEKEAEAARALIRKAMTYYVTLDYYNRAWRELGFEDSDFCDGGSDRLIDGVAAWGSIDQVRARVSEQFDAGATRLIVIPLNASRGVPDWGVLAELAAR